MLVTSLVAASGWTLLALVEAIQDRGKGTFSRPLAAVRPRFRYWLPDASVDAEIVASDIKAAGLIGAGGVEFVPFYNYGGELGPPPASINWTEYGFGLPAYRELFKKALHAASENDLLLDIALGPNQGQGVPAEIDNEGLQWDLVAHSVPIPVDGSFSDVVPGWSAGARLVSVTSAAVVSAEDKTMPIRGLELGLVYNWTKFVINEESLTDLTPMINRSSGQLSFNVSDFSSDRDYQLTVIYEEKTLAHAQIPAGTKAETYLQNGSYTVDHLSARGAAVTTNFWDSVMLEDKETLELVRKVGNYMWEDSMELKARIQWTPDFPAVFESDHNYTIQKYLPLILYGNGNGVVASSTPGKFEFVSATPNSAQVIINDYRKTVGSCYRRYMQGIRSWAKERLGLQTSMQVSYNLPMDALANVPFVDAPEAESLQFGGGAIDSFRQYAGPANLAGKILSCELGAVFGKGYQQQLPDLLLLLNRAFAGGVNQHVLHGQVFSGIYPNTTWPGYTAFNYYVAELWSPRQPLWDHGLADILHYTARVSFVLQSGVAKTDIAFYQKDSVTNPNFQTQYNFTDLTVAGYTYNYLSPENLFLPGITVENGTLAAKGTAYKALVIKDTQNLTITGGQRILEFARAGLPIIFAGGTPRIFPEEQQQSPSSITRALDELKGLPNVYQTEQNSVATKLAQIGIVPRVVFQGNDNGTVYTVWRQIEKTNTDYLFVYSDVQASSVTLIVQTTQKPYILDPWTGSINPLLFYQEKMDTLVIPLQLKGNQSTILAFSSGLFEDIPTPELHLESKQANVIDASFSPEDGFYVHFINSATVDNFKVYSSSGEILHMQPQPVPASFILPNWSLTVEHWDPPTDLYNLSVNAVKMNTSHELVAPVLPWPKISGLNNTAGIGYYRTNFTWNATTHDFGALLVLDDIPNSARLTINGQTTPPFDLSNPMTDITPYLRKGNNSILIITASSYWNGIVRYLQDLESAGRNLLFALGIPISGPLDEGLVGTVTIVPFKKVKVQS